MHAHFAGISFGQAAVAKEQLKEKIPTPPPPPDTVEPDVDDDGNFPTPPEKDNGKEKDSPPLPKHFYMDAELNTVRYSKELKKYIDEIAYHLIDLPNAKTSIRVTIDISVPDGVPQYLKEIVEGNCADLGIDAEHFHFES